MKPIITAGVDVGARFLKISIVRDEKLAGWAVHEMERDFKGLYKDTLRKACAMAGTKKRKIKRIVATGYGAHLIKKAAWSISVPPCNARAAHEAAPESDLIIDAGALFIRIVRKGPTGILEETAVNEQCAAGSGKFLEMIVQSLEIPFAETSSLISKSKNPQKIQNSCAVFAESDVISSINSGRPREDVLAGIIDSIAGKTLSLMEGTGEYKVASAAGGLSLVDAYMRSLSRQAGIEISTLPFDGRLLSSYGAALLGSDSLKKGR